MYYTVKLKNRHAIYLIAILSILSCTNPTIQPDHTKENKDTLRIKPSSGFSDTIIVSIPSAIFFKPDSLQLKKIKMVTDSAIFESMQHDCFYQMRNSANVLASQYLNIKIIYAVNNSRFLFKMSNGQIKIIDLRSNNDPCGIYLFSPDKEPRLADMTNIDTELGVLFF